MWGLTLDSRVHNDVGVLRTLALRTSLDLPPLLRREYGEDDSLTGSDGRDSKGLLVRRVERRVEQSGLGRSQPQSWECADDCTYDDVDAASLDLSTGGILLDVNEVLGEILHHELLRLGLLVSRNERCEIERRCSVEEELVVSTPHLGVVSGTLGPPSAVHSHKSRRLLGRHLSIR